MAFLSEQDILDARRFQEERLEDCRRNCQEILDRAYAFGDERLENNRQFYDKLLTNAHERTDFANSRSIWMFYLGVMAGVCLAVIVLRS